MDGILIKTKFRVVGTRTNLKTLKPICFVDQEISHNLHSIFLKKLYLVNFIRPLIIGFWLF
jgi:hypothetical protein